MFVFVVRQERFVGNGISYDEDIEHGRFEFRDLVRGSANVKEHVLKSFRVPEAGYVLIVDDVDLLKM